MKLIWIALRIFLVVLGGHATMAHASKYDTWDEGYYVSALLGVAKYDNLKLNLPDGATAEETDLSLLPQLGGAWNTLPLGDRLQCGLEASFLLGFQADELNYLSAGGSGLYVSVSTSMWMFDLAGGAYANVYLDPNRNVRAYVGGGPLIMYASYRVDRDYSDGSDGDSETESHLGIGAYARTGIEFRVHDRGMLGVGARTTWTHIDFTDVGGRAEMTGIGGFITYTAGF